MEKTTVYRRVQRKRRWIPTSDIHLEEAEKLVFSLIGVPFEATFVTIDSCVGGSQEIRTLIFKSPSVGDAIPAVLIHGFASGVGLWSRNFHHLVATRPVYAIDLLGFGRSSRPIFSSHADEAELQLVQSIEAWRKKMGLEKFIIIGHSMGGFLSASYAISYPHRIAHAILSDPWGFPERPNPFWINNFTYLFENFNPLFIVRAAGPFGLRLVWGAKKQLVHDLAGAVSGAKYKLANYIYQVNVQKPTGEAAFRTMSSGYFWAKHPMVQRIDRLSKNVPLTLVYGELSWIPRVTDETMRYLRKDAYLDIHTIKGAGHEIYTDEEFNRILLKACKIADLREEFGNQIQCK